MSFGSVLNEEQDSAASRKGRGAFFTPSALTSFVCTRSIVDARSCVLEPSCGEGEFILAAAERLRSLGASNDEIDRQITGCELHGLTVSAALDRLSSKGLRPAIVEGDFFSFPADSRFDAVIGNPPYIRYQEFSGSQRMIALQRSNEQGVKLSSLASSWAPFVIHACGFLKQSGAVGMVLPAELLSSNYAGPVRAYLLEHFKRVEVHLFEHAVFPDVEEEVVVLLATGFLRGPSAGVHIAQHHSLEMRLTAEPVFCSATGLGRWPLGETGSRAAALLSELEHMVPLNAWGDVRLGAVTGANQYFCLTGSEIEECGLSKRDLVRVCPAGSSHLRQLRLDEDELDELDRKEQSTYLFFPEDEDKPTPAAQAYLARGVELGVDQRYKCRTRKVWWRVPGVGLCDIFVTYMNGAGPNLCENAANVAFLNSVHGLTLKESVRDLGRRVLPIVYLSSVSQLSAEVYGRAYGGGILKLEPREAARTLVPDAESSQLLERGMLSQEDRIDSLLLAGERERATEMVDVVLEECGIIEAGTNREASLLLSALRNRRANRSSGKEKSYAR